MSAARKKLEEALDASFAPVREEASDAYREVVDLLWGFAGKVAANVNPAGGAAAEVKVVPGHLVNQGQEHRLVIRAPGIGLSDFLLRAFVPPAGYPVVLDLFSEGDRVCADTDALVKALVEASEHPSMRERLKAIRNLLLDETLRGEPKVVGNVRKGVAAKPAVPAASPEKRPTPYQTLLGLLAERNVITLKEAQTATGMTAAGLRPVLQQLVKEGKAGAEGAKQNVKYRRKGKAS